MSGNRLIVPSNMVWPVSNVTKERSRDFPIAIQDFARNYVDFQKQRHTADYDPDKKFRHHEVLSTIAIAEVAIKKFQQLESKHRTAFAIWVTMKNRTE